MIYATGHSNSSNHVHPETMCKDPPPPPIPIEDPYIQLNPVPFFQ